VDKQTIIEMEIGFTYEVFKKKQVLADQRFAERINSRDTVPLAVPSTRQRPSESEVAGRGMRAAEVEELLRQAAS
jgi:hypothetical protein